jgi:hypothetical protein
MTGRPDQVRSDAVSVLRDVLRWRLTPDRWGGISAILENLGTGLDLSNPGQLAALDEASVALELAAPVLITEIDKLTGPAPDSVRERVNLLIYELSPRAGQDAYDAARVTE